MTRMKGMLLATALMIAAAQSNDPFRTPRRNTGVRRNDNQRKPKPVVRELREFTVKVIRLWLTPARTLLHG